MPAATSTQQNPRPLPKVVEMLRTSIAAAAEGRKLRKKAAREELRDADKGLVEEIDRALKLRLPWTDITEASGITRQTYYEMKNGQPSNRKKASRRKSK